MGPRLVSFVSSFRPTQVMRPYREVDTEVESALALGWAVLGRDLCVAFLVAGKGTPGCATAVISYLHGFAPSLCHSIGYFLSRVPWSHLLRNINYYGKRGEVSCGSKYGPWSMPTPSLELLNVHQGTKPRRNPEAKKLCQPFPLYRAGWFCSSLSAMAQPSQLARVSVELK